MRFRTLSKLIIKMKGEIIMIYGYARVSAKTQLILVINKKFLI